MIRGILFRSWFVVSFVSCLFVGLASYSFADFSIVTRDGKNLTWPSFLLEDGNYCTWKNGGKFCLPMSDVVSIREVTASDELYGGQTQVPTRSITGTQSGERRGTMTRSIGQASVDGRSAYVGGGGRRGGSSYQGYDVNGSSTTYATDIDAADIRRMEADADAKRIEQQDRRQELERDRQMEISQQKQREEQERRNREQQREWDRVRVK